MILLYVFAILAIIQGLVSFIEGLRWMRFVMRRPAAAPADSGRVRVFCPCKGVDHELQKNVQSIVDQDYPDFDTCFIVESERDTAFPLLKQMGLRVIVAGNAQDCGQKVHNLKFAIESAGSGADVYVFCDSDARYPREWLRRLVTPLSDRRIAITTGYRWYAATRFHFSTLLRSAWNASVVSMLGDHGRNFAWGGSMAMRRETFEKMGILDAWRGSVSDDYSVTRAAQKAGARIDFVPGCLVPSYGECSLGEMLEFTTRQITITRVYHPRLWGVGFVAQTMFNLTFWGLLVTGSFMLWGAIMALAAAKSVVRHRGARVALGDPSLSRFGWFYILSSPVVALVYEYNMIRSALTRNIVWRRIQYSLISPNETRVHRLSKEEP